MGEVTECSASPSLSLVFSSNSAELSKGDPAFLLRSFEDEFRKTGCSLNQMATPAGNAPAAYLPFIYYPLNGGLTFQNEILVNQYVMASDGKTILNRTPEQMSISQRHEKLHARQWATVPALHASPYNQATPVVLSPESWVLMTILTERDAYTKTAWLNALELRLSASERFRNQAMTETLTPDDIDLDAADMRASLQKASLAWDGRLKHKSKAGDPDMTLLDHYIQNALDVYEQSNRLNIEKSPVRPIFVKLSADDILAIGSSFGPSIFGEGTPDEAFTKLPPMPQALRDRLDALNKKHGITSETNLPTFSDAIERLGYTPETFMTCSKSFVHIVSKGQKPVQSEQSYEIEIRSADNAPAPAP